MGCDIHAFLEVKLGGHWAHYGPVEIERSYGLFARMAGVRNDLDDPVKPVVRPRGFPEDASATTRHHYERWGRDAHTASWFGPKEMKIIEEEQGEQVRRHGYAHYYNNVNLSDSMAAVQRVANDQKESPRVLLDKVSSMAGEALKSFSGDSRRELLFSRDGAGLWFFGSQINGWWLYPDERPEGVEDIRLVFWFDN